VTCRRNPLNVKHVVVVGAGIVGLAIAHYLQKDGIAVTVVDRDPEGDKASFGNAGGIAVTEVVPASIPGLLWRAPGWLLDPLGPLSVRPAHAPRLLKWLWHFSRAGSPSEVARISAALAALNSRVYDDLLPMLSDAGLSNELHRKGALTVYETEDGYDRDRDQWKLKRFHSIEVEEISGHEARRLEPALGPIVQRAVFTPQWSHINDPKTLVDGLRLSLRTRGVQILPGTVTEVSVSGTGHVAAVLQDGRTVAAHDIVIAAGAWSGQLAKRLGDKVPLESERGYNTTLTEPGVALGREIIFAEKSFVATPLSCGLRIGGAAEFGGLKALANYERSDALVKLALRYLPELRSGGGKNWAGHRPATPDSLPVIGPSLAHRGIFYAFGHGHLGLTQAATTGRLIADLVNGRPSTVDLAPYRVDRFS
jgi:D-amino-acid dehydrogenase